MPNARFRGTFTHTIDERGRIAVPARYQHHFMNDQGEGWAVLFPNPHADGSLWMFTVSEFEEMAEQVARPGKLDKAAVELQERIYAAAYDVKLDRQGRILIEQALRDELPDLRGPAKVRGMGNRLEIWPSESLAARRAEPKPDFDILLAEGDPAPAAEAAS